MRLAAPRFSCASTFFAVGAKKSAGSFSPQAFFLGLLRRRCFFFRPIAPQAIFFGVLLIF